jgi:hypothetical protein
VAGIYQEPFYRMRLHSATRSRQHHLLCSLEEAKTAAVVYYVAATFHTEEDFNRHSAAGTIAAHSFYARPSEAGHFPDSKAHHFAYLPDGSQPHFFSQPRPLGTARDSNDFRHGLREALGERGRAGLTRARVLELSETLLRIADDDRRTRVQATVVREGLQARALAQSRDEHPIERLETLARTLLGCGLFIVTPSDSGR